MNRIQNDEGEWLEQQHEIAEAAEKFYKEQFKKFVMLDELPTIISNEENEDLQRMPIKEEVQRAVIELNRNSARGPYGMTGVFYQDTWEKLEDDVFNMVQIFFCGAELPRFITHTNLALLPK